MSEIEFKQPYYFQNKNEREIAYDSFLLETNILPKPTEVSRVSDAQPVPDQADSARQATFEFLNQAKAHMDRFNEASKGVNQSIMVEALSQGEQAYVQSREIADKFLWRRTEDGALLKDNQGQPIPTEAAIALQKERQTILREVEELGNGADVDDRQLVQAKLQELKTIDDTLRMSGYVRANHALGLLFACAHLNATDSQIYRRRAEELLVDAQLTDPETKDDPNFKRHYQLAVHGPAHEAPPKSTNLAPRDNASPKNIELARSDDASLSVPQAEKLGESPSTSQASLTPEQESAQAEAQQVYEKWMELSENGNKVVPREQWTSIEQLFQLTLQHAESLKQDQIDGIAMTLQSEYERILRGVVASEKQIARESVLSGDLVIKEQALRAEYTAMQQGLARALETLPPESVTQLQSKYQTELQQKVAQIQSEAQTAKKATTDPLSLIKIEEKQRQQLEAAQLDIVVRFNEAKKALSPELKTVMEVISAFESKQVGVATIQLLQLQSEVQRLRDAPAMIKMFYAHALVAQGDNPKAKQLLQSALSNATVAKELDRTTVGQTLAGKLGLETAAMLASKAQVEQYIPELKKIEQAMALMNDQSREPAEAFEKACKLFEEALKLTDRSNRKIEDLVADQASIDSNYESALQDLKSGKRQEFTSEELRKFEAAPIVVAQANNIALVRYQYALMLNAYGWTHNDETAKTKSLKVLKSIEDVAGIKLIPHSLQGVIGPITLCEKSPEIVGARKQVEQYKRIDPQTAAAEGLVDAARSTFGVSPIDGLVLPGAAAVPESIPFLGPVLFENKSEQKKAISFLAEAHARNPAATAAEVEHSAKSSSSGWRDTIGDFGAIAAGYVAKAGLDLASKCATKNPYAKVAVSATSILAPLVVSGETKSYIDTGKLTFDPTDRSFLRGAGIYALARGTDGMMQWQAGRNSLSKSTLEGLSARYRIPVEKLGTSIGSVRQAMVAEHKSLIGSVGREATQIQNAQLGKLSQSILPGSRLSYVHPRALIPGSTDASMRAFTAEKIDFIQLGARDCWNKNLYGTFLPAAAFGSGRKMLYIGTGELQPDGTPYTLNTTSGISKALKASAWEGGQTAAAAAIFIPMSIPFAKMGVSSIENSGVLLSSAGTGARSAGESLLQRGTGSAAQGGWQKFAGLCLQGLGQTVKAGSIPLEALRIPGSALQGTGYALRRLPDAGIGALRLAGASESGIATVGNLSLVGAQPTLLSLDQQNRSNKLKRAYNEMLKTTAPTADTSLPNGKIP